MRFYYKNILLPLVLVIGIASCKKWDDHIAVPDQNLNMNLQGAVEANPQLSKFREYVTMTGLDTLLRSSKTYTIWAPDNNAMNALDQSIVADKAQLRSFLLNHISNQSYFTRDVTTTPLRIQMLTGKYNNFSATKFDEATINTADQYVKNGVLHVISKIVLVLPSLWDFVNSTTAQYNQDAFIAGLNFEGFDPATAIVDSISAVTGLPVYHPGTGVVLKNKFNDRVHDLKNESKQYTYFVIANPGFALESDSLKAWYATGNMTSTDSLAKWNTVRDLAVEGIVVPAAFPGLVSKHGVAIPANAANIIETKKLSNGIAYVMSTLDVVGASKLKNIMVQGEFPSGFLSDKTGNTNYRIRLNPVTHLNFTDLLVSGHGVTAYYAYYHLNEMPSIKYKVYASAINDFQTGALVQSIVVKYVTPTVPLVTYTTLATLSHSVPLYTAVGAYNELYLGDVTISNYGTLEIQLTATTTGPIVLDYLRLEPAP